MKTKKINTQAVVSAFSMNKETWQVIVNQASKEQRTINGMIRYILTMWAAQSTNRVEQTLKENINGK